MFNSFDFSYTAFVVLIPSTTILILSSASSFVSPYPINSPNLLFLLYFDIQVTIRSPIPESPKNVSFNPPSNIPNLTISAIPRQNRPAFVLSPKPNPSEIPQAMAIMFFKAPPNSTPIISGFV